MPAVFVPHGASRDSVCKGTLNMKEELLKKIDEIVAGEKLAMDSYFFCGSGSSLPDDELIRAGEAYLTAEKNGIPDLEAKVKLIERLEAAANKGQEVLKARVLIDAEDTKTVVIKEILANKDLL